MSNRRQGGAIQDGPQWQPLRFFRRQIAQWKTYAPRLPRGVGGFARQTRLLLEASSVRFQARCVPSLSCDSHQSGLFRLSSYGQGLPSSQLTFPHPAQYFRWNSSSHGASMTGRPRKKAPSVSGFFVISSKLFTAKPPLRIDRGFAAAFEVFLYALLCKNGVVCFP